MRNFGCSPRSWVACAAAWIVVAAPSLARAGSFAQDGSFLFDPGAASSEGFEDYVLEGEAGANAQIIEGEDPLEGLKLLRLQSEGYGSTFTVPITLPATQQVYVASVWLRGSAAATLSVSYADQTPGDSAQLFATGRMTSDGWYEVASGPVHVDGPRGPKVGLSLRGTSDVDGLEVVAVSSPAFKEPRSCKGIADQVCGQEALCLAGWCRNTPALVPPVPEGDKRARLSEYLQNRLQFFFGPYRNRKEDLPSAVAEMKAAGAAEGRFRFWNGLATAVHRLQDWHSSTTGRALMSVRNRRPMNVCFFEGDADLSQQQAPSDPSLPDILVSHIGTDYAWGLKQGDRLLAVDGKHPIAWMRSLIAHNWSYHSANDPETLSDFAQALSDTIPLFARSITVVRCTGSLCGDQEEIDVFSIPEVPSGTHVEGVACDQRPSFIVQGVPANHGVGASAYGGLVTGTAAEEKIYGMVWDYLLGQGQNDVDIKKQVATWVDARGVVLDHRTGYGGTQPGPEPILAFVRTPKPILVDLWRAYYDDEGPKDLAEGLALFNANKSSAWAPGSSQAKIDVPVALLITLDGSEADFFAWAMKGSPKVRIFGPHGTVGAFSSFLGLNYWNAIAFQVGCMDTVSFEGQMLSGHGAQPDEVVWPKQSDLVQGKDTLAERAIAWVRSEVKP